MSRERFLFFHTVTGYRPVHDCMIITLPPVTQIRKNINWILVTILTFTEIMATLPLYFNSGVKKVI